VNSRLLTPPVEVITTTISTCGCSVSTSMWRTVAVSIGGAVTIASRFVTCDRGLSRDPHRLIDLATHQGEPQWRRVDVLGEQTVDEVPVAGLCRNPPGGRVRMLEQPQLLEACELVADRGGSHAKPVASDFEPTGAPAARLFLDDAAQNQFLTFAQHPEDSRSAAGDASGAVSAADSATGSADAQLGDGVADQARAALGRFELGARDTSATEETSPLTTTPRRSAPCRGIGR